MKTIAKASVDFTMFKFGDQEIRVLSKGGEPWFVAKDVCDVLKLVNSRDGIARLDNDEKGVALTDTLGGNQEVAIVSESGMYTLVLRCRDAIKPGTVPHSFRKWVTSEVLPTIRKTGQYQLKPKTTVDDRTPLRNAVNLLVSKKHLMYPEAYAIVHQRFAVDSIEDLSRDQVGQAVEYIHRIVLDGDYLGREELPMQLRQFTDKELCDLCWLWNAAEFMRERIEHVYPAMRMLNSEYAGSFYSMAVEYKRTLEEGRKVLERETRDMTPDPDTLMGLNLQRVLPRLRRQTKSSNGICHNNGHFNFV